MVSEAARGSHAHKQLQQLMVATSGSVHVTLDDGVNKKTFVLDKPWKGLHVVPGLWRDLDNFAGGTQYVWFLRVNIMRKRIISAIMMNF